MYEYNYSLSYQWGGRRTNGRVGTKGTFISCPNYKSWSVFQKSVGGVYEAKLQGGLTVACKLYCLTVHLSLSPSSPLTFLLSHLPASRLTSLPPSCTFLLSHTSILTPLSSSFLPASPASPPLTRLTPLSVTFPSSSHKSHSFPIPYSWHALPHPLTQHCDHILIYSLSYFRSFLSHYCPHTCPLSYLLGLRVLWTRSGVLMYHWIVTCIYALRHA